MADLITNVIIFGSWGVLIHEYMIHTSPAWNERNNEASTRSLFPWLHIYLLVSYACQAFKVHLSLWDFTSIYSFRVKCTWVLKLLGHYHLGTRTEKATTWVLKLLGHYHLGTRTKKPPTWVLKLLDHYHLGTRVGAGKWILILFLFLKMDE